MEFKKRGTLFVPVKPVVLEFPCKVHQKMTESNKKMYIQLALGDVTKNRIHEIHKASNEHLQKKLINPLEGSVLKIKVPYKYDKVACKVSGNKALQELGQGDQVTVTIEYCGVWEVNGYCGPSWKLFSLHH